MHPTEIALNDYVDDRLPPAARAEVEQHLESCAECRALVADLRAVTQAAGELPALAPPDEVWTRIRATLMDRGTESAAPDGETAAPGDDRAAPRADSPAPPLPETASPARDTGRTPVRAPRPSGAPAWKWLAAAAVIVLAAGASWFGVTRSGRGPAAPPVQATATPPDAQAVAAELQQAEQHYQKAISGLEQIASSEKGALDPATAATLEKNLAVVDQAIGESRAALKQQPTSEPAQQSLLENFRTKLALLEDTVALINEMRKGNEAGAARIASGLNKKG